MTNNIFLFLTNTSHKFDCFDFCRFEVEQVFKAKVFRILGVEEDILAEDQKN